MYVRAVIALALLAGWTWVVHDYASSEADAEIAELKADLAAERTELANERLAHEQAARKLEHAKAARNHAAAAAYERGKADAQAAADAVVADLSADRLRLRQHWRGCVATSELSAAAARARELDGLAQLRNEAAGAVVRVGADCDAHVRGLQRVAQP